MEAKQKLIDETFFWFDYASEKLNKSFNHPTILFDLKGTTAGQAFTFSNKIRYNIGIAQENLDLFLETTVPHEVAHVTADVYFGKRCNHGKGWKWMMSEVFGKKPERCHSYDVSNHRARNTKRYLYQCLCEKGCLCGPKHHKKIQLNVSAKIFCRRCKTYLSPELLINTIDKVPTV